MVTKSSVYVQEKEELTSQTQYLADTHCLDLRYLVVIIATRLLAAVLHLPTNSSPNRELLMWEMRWSAIKFILYTAINIQ